jgi:hypothetical protein
MISIRLQSQIVTASRQKTRAKTKTQKKTNSYLFLQNMEIFFAWNLADYSYLSIPILKKKLKQKKYVRWCVCQISNLAIK